MRKTHFFLPALLTASLSSAFAHTTLSSSSPAEDEVLQAPPEALQLDFNDQVHLLEALIVDSDGRRVNDDYRPPEQAARSFSVPLPTLPTGEYSVSWTVEGEEDGHVMLGDYRFTIEAAP